MPTKAPQAFQHFVKDMPKNAIRMTGKLEARAVNEEALEIEFVMSNFKRDDYGTRFDPSGVDLAQYMRNPLVSFGHMRDGGIYRLPVGRGKTDTIRVDNEGNLRMVVQFTPKEVFEFGYQIYKLVKNGFLNMGSIAAEIQEEEMVKEPTGETTIVFRKWKLYDFSIVPLGANDDAMVTQRCKELGLERESIMQAERDITQRATEAEDEEVEKVAEALTPPAEEDVQLEGKVVAKEDEDDEEDSGDLSAEVECEIDGAAITFTVRAKCGAKELHKSIYRSFEVKESDEQVKYREYFESNQPILKLYRTLLSRAFTRVGVVQPKDERAAIAQLEMLYYRTENAEQARSAETRRPSPADISSLTESLVSAVAQAEREAIQNGLPLRKIPSFRKKIIGETLRSISSPQQQ